MLVRGEFFRLPILANRGAGFLFSLRVARAGSSSGKRAKPIFHLATLFARRGAKAGIWHRDWLKLAGEGVRRGQVGAVPAFLSVRANGVAKWKTGLKTLSCDVGIHVQPVAVNYTRVSTMWSSR